MKPVFVIASLCSLNYLPLLSLVYLYVQHAKKYIFIYLSLWEEATHDFSLEVLKFILVEIL